MRTVAVPYGSETRAHEAPAACMSAKSLLTPRAFGPQYSISCCSEIPLAGREGAAVGAWGAAPAGRVWGSPIISARPSSAATTGRREQTMASPDHRGPQPSVRRATDSVNAAFQGLKSASDGGPHV